MTIKDFKALNEDAQQSIVSLRGVTLSIINWEDYRVLLFSLDGFYVEYFFHRKTSELA